MECSRMTGMTLIPMPAPWNSLLGTRATFHPLAIAVFLWMWNGNTKNMLYPDHNKPLPSSFLLPPAATSKPDWSPPLESVPKKSEKIPIQQAGLPLMSAAESIMPFLGLAGIWAPMFRTDPQKLLWVGGPTDSGSRGRTPSPAPSSAGTWPQRRPQLSQNLPHGTYPISLQEQFPGNR